MVYQGAHDMLVVMDQRLRNAGITLQRMVWTRRAQSWEDTPNPGLNRVTNEIVRLASEQPFDVAVDLGCGSGQLALPLASYAKHVIAVDIAPTMLEILSKKAASQQISNVETRCDALESLKINDASVDLIVSNYVLHHLADTDKAAIVNASHRWLKPGGRFILGDMMFGRGATVEDRKIIAEKLRKLALLGPGGWWRILKNVARFTFRIQEKPVSAETWRRYLEQAGFKEITITPFVAEASIAIATKSSS